MTAERAFSLANLIALAGWALLIAFPKRRWAAPIAAGVAIPALLACAYVGLIAAHIGGSQGGFSSLAAVAQLFADPWLLLAGWIHYLAFDLFIGAWQARDAARAGLPHLALVPCLALTFLFGPAGLLAYLCVRAVHQRKVAIAAE